MRTVKVVFPLVVDVRCFSHTVDCVGDHLNILKRFWQLWNSLFGTVLPLDSLGESALVSL